MEENPYKATQAVERATQPVSSGKAIALAVFTAWPFLYVVIFASFMCAMIRSDLPGTGNTGEPPALKWILLSLHLLTMLEAAVLLVIYIRHVFKTDRVPQDKKALWAVVLFLGNLLAMPIYWYLYIWREGRR